MEKIRLFKKTIVKVVGKKLNSTGIDTHLGFVPLPIVIPVAVNNNVDKFSGKYQQDWYMIIPCFLLGIHLPHNCRIIIIKPGHYCIFDISENNAKELSGLRVVAYANNRIGDKTTGHHTGIGIVSISKTSWKKAIITQLGETNYILNSFSLKGEYNPILGKLVVDIHKNLD